MTLDKSGLKYVNTNYIPHRDVLLLLSLLFPKPSQCIKHCCDILGNEYQEQSICVQHSKENAEKDKQYVNLANSVVYIVCYTDLKMCYTIKYWIYITCIYVLLVYRIPLGRLAKVTTSGCIK